MIAAHMLFRRTPLIAIAAMAMTFAAHAQVDPGRPGSGRPVTVEKDSSADRVVSVVHRGNFSYVRIESREAGAESNQHPYRVPINTLRGMLATVQLPGGKGEPLFNADELDEIAGPLSTALSEATADQDVSFAVSGRHGYLGPLAPRVVTTGRVFRRGEALEIVFGYVRKDFESQFRATGYLIPFEPGQRAKPVDAQVKLAVAPSSGSSKRADWVALSVAQAAPVAAPAAAGGAAASRGAAPAQPSSGTGTMGTTAETIFANISERLKALQKLKDSGLITEQEYQEKRRALLRDL